MVKVKICGITNLEDAQVAANAGCDALGFIFFKKSPRYISPEKARQIIKQLPARVVKIGVFANAKEKTIKQVARFCHLQMLQFHGNESPEFCRKFKNYKIIKTFRIKNILDLRKALRYKPFAFLFDTFSKKKLGGTGKSFNWQLVSRLEKIKQPIFLAGGLNAKNVEAAIKTVHPAWVDASSSLEARPGKKDLQKVKSFVQAAKSCRKN
jgi:phosphoribosylanthranilate isomerase